MSSVYANRNPTEGFGYKKKGGIGGCMHAGNGQWLKLDFRAVVSVSKISSVRIMAHESPRSWKVEYSTDGHSWTKVGDFNGDGEKTVNAQARYVRAVVTRSSGTRADCLNLKVSGGGSVGAPAGGGTWVVGTPQQKCRDTCSAKGLVCNAQSEAGMRAINTEAKMRAVCPYSRIKKGPWASQYYPSVRFGDMGCGHGNDKCCFWHPSSTITCTSNTPQHLMPSFCLCMPR